ncbi:MAG: TraB/GumN family protein, partial [Saprospiraceae bacterium]|nr:TraB/GumN family protein [Saprospiraceae bacterium]
MKASKKTWLWEISREDLPGTHYLFGTVHIKSEKVFRWLEPAFEFLDQCETVATEYDLGENSGKNPLQTLQTDPDYRLSEVLRPKKFSRLERIFFEATGLQLILYDKVHPFILISLITQAVLPSERPRAMDEEIWLRALNNGKQTCGLETLASQMNLILEMDQSYFVDQLKALGRNFSRFKSRQNKLVDLYTLGDLPK